MILSAIVCHIMIVTDTKLVVHSGLLLLDWHSCWRSVWIQLQITPALFTIGLIGILRISPLPIMSPVGLFLGILLAALRLALRRLLGCLLQQFPRLLILLGPARVGPPTLHIVAVA